jgi:hypothetical protein
MMRLKKLERYIYSTGIIIGEEKISEMISISLGRRKPKDLFNNLGPKFNIFNEKRKRQYYNGEEILEGDDIIKGNSAICNDATKRASLRRRLIKKRVKYREKQKKKALIREELIQEENECLIHMKEVRFKKESPDRPKEELSKRNIKAAASTLYGLKIANKNLQRTSNWIRTEKDIKILIGPLVKRIWNPKK